MGKKGGSRHLKRFPAPKDWPIHRKEYKWVVKPIPGPYPIGHCLPLLIIIRDILKIAKNRREVKIILSQGNIRVNGKVIRNDAFPVGLMDVIDIPELQKTYRVIHTTQKGLTLHPIKGEEKEFKLCKVINKTTVKGGHIQLNLNDGRNKLIKVADPDNPVEDEYKTLDILKISIPEGEITGHVQFKEGNVAIVTGGKNRGIWGKLTRVEERRSLHLPIVTLEGNGIQFKTSLNNVFVIGDVEPWISLPEV